MDFIVQKLRDLDPKVVYGALTFVATYIVVNLLGLDPNDILVTVGTVDITWAAAIAFVAAEGVAYFKANVGTVLREDHEDGNADLTEAGYSVIELLIAAILLIVFLYVVVAVVD